MKIKDIILEAAYHDAAWVDKSESLERRHRLAVKQGDTEQAKKLEKEIKDHYKKGATNEAKEIDDWDDEDDYSDVPLPKVKNIMDQLLQAQDLGFSEIEFEEGSDTLKPKTIDLFVDLYRSVKNKEQMAKKAVISKKHFLDALKAAAAGQYGKDQSQYTGIGRSSRGGPTIYT
jgi:hypothetical protein